MEKILLNMNFNIDDFTKGQTQNICYVISSNYFPNCVI